LKLTELFKSTTHGGKRIRGDSRLFTIKKRIGDRDIMFSASNSGTFWEVYFAEHRDDGTSTVDKTGSGNEIEVFNFIVSCFRELIEEEHPKRMLFSCAKEDESRVKLYQHMVNRFAKGYEITQVEVGTGRMPKSIMFDLTIKS
jgi:hypothetical protein